MKTFIILICLLGCFSFAGYANHPIDPPKKTSEKDKTVAPPDQVTTEQCSDSRGLVDVTIYVTFTDCPDYDCEAKDCSFDICVYDNYYNLLDCQSFDPEVCSYTFPDLRANENEYLRAHLVEVWQPCEHEYYDGWPQSNNVVPQGGGDVYIDTHFCQ